ncbi:MAG TPA: acyl carrier protein [Acidimicrobiales bacterium]|nr:acyl carrier protein [Acidimicrobiales bacterium]
MDDDRARTVIAEALHGIAPEADLDTVDPDEALQEELDLDSMDFLNLVTAVYEATGLEIPERDYPEVSTLGGFVRYLSARATA